MSNATAEATKTIPFRSTTIAGIHYGVSSVGCNSYEHFRDMPNVVTHEGIRYWKTGWNSDNGNVAYSSEEWARRQYAVA